MTLESKKLLLIRQIMEINDEGVIDDLEQYVEEKAQHKSDNDILQQLARPIRPHFDLEAIKREQGYQPINKEELNQLIKELDIQEPLEELLEMIGK
jgi:Glu-tRNA(Gln) amidotransferase subunit E-like FAD-binding protein